MPTDRATLKRGDYVLATKYRDGDPRDHWCVGYYDRPLPNDFCQRHIVVDANGNCFRANGFQRVAKISARRGNLIVPRMKTMEWHRFRVWYWFHCPLAEIEALEITP